MGFSIPDADTLAGPVDAHGQRTEGKLGRIRATLERLAGELPYRDERRPLLPEALAAVKAAQAEMSEPNGRDASTVHRHLASVALETFSAEIGAPLTDARRMAREGFDS